LTIVFFTDRDLGNRFPDILETAGLKVERHKDNFAQDCADTVWLEAAGQSGWIALTRDRRIRYKPNELNAVIRHGVALLVVVGTAPHAALAEAFVATVPRITSFLDDNSPPFIGKVYRPSPGERARNPNAPGRVARWYP
jgi:hypothetical protein